MQSKAKRNPKRGAIHNIYQDPRLRIQGWRAALKSARTPRWLLAGIRENIRRLESRLKKRRP